MRLILLKSDYLSQLLELEKRMYWKDGRWEKIWQEGAQEKFRQFLADYLENFPEGCFGFKDPGGKILGALFLPRVSKMITIPYLHRFSDIFESRGKIGYVSFFVVKEGPDQDLVTPKLYARAEQVAAKLGCEKIMTVVYRSLVEKEVIQKRSYLKSEKLESWEIHPQVFVDSWVYTKKLGA
ncbi:hypothetical protein COS81_03500 [candidate division WWE3 bacterium CG06_land_8_20_14_3_00_42_16]|uniref:N-acetyltransferase domain-containing protein n=4 Tax=Katanobacteria TaxID=422282 RepID=A0A2M7AMF3_UNCKA|nr:MAG: hypothetical protein COS81_03500 [candidate division WWE3 bacterium CG06_land_8_20_14_3_00_42_16]PIZ42809.1 MAG: hypothetical protein COY34_02135 [candidate division WWE3 bacterium CG_4_10_14_0_2_um_filter_42_8]PJA37608.1 MAG: hypothetical protein CO181_02795 [candidate division WWE3 bacterium CG_4_9_14_3_um_filter_43_9]PJC69167.1 MAG: hypothetical protein CO015_01325 [candidate division WWE3 bacterium CG_4_8_14_3_um_filter_42_11]